ncbi:hypothetical protein F4859DRAFT_524948 [Xylaria cf. heliscus]|nr:hypothetical protein F4859DRAFT_524948 [Xylaria cf. heliscus]
MNDSEGNAAVHGYLDDERFYQTFKLPPNARRQADFNVTYADFGHRTDEHVLLRFLLTTKDKLAQQHGVRILSPDRPGFGGTTDVPPADRVTVWLEIVEALVKHLAIRHISILGYSGGSIYAMNILLHLRYLLHPTRPYVALCAPWVHPSHSGVPTLKLAGLLPNGLVGRYNQLVQFVGSMGSAFHYSDILAGLVPSLSRGSNPVVTGADPDAVALEESLATEIFRRMMNEDVRGISQDALLLLKRDEYPGCWGTWDDYDKLVPLLAQAEMEMERHATDSSPVSPLRVHVFYAESDMMIGTTVASAWLDNCWRSEQRGEAIDYSTVTIPKTTHNNILDLKYGQSIKNPTPAAVPGIYYNHVSQIDLSTLLLTAPRYSIVDTVDTPSSNTSDGAEKNDISSE